jgi:O-acetyl-ADP-ribose deacetylase (regulator of RNase III)
VWRGGRAGEPALLEACYVNSLELALEHDLASIAFPAISTGVYGYPGEQAAGIAVAAMRRFAPRFERIVACCFSESDAEIYRALLQRPIPPMQAGNRPLS